MEFKGISKTVINVGGKTYHSVEELPPDLRRFFEDRDEDGIPDIAQGASGAETTWTINGVTYHSLEEIPPDIRVIAERMEGMGDEPGGMRLAEDSTRTFEKEPRAKPRTTGIPTPIAMALGAILMAVALGVWLWVKG